MKKTITKLLAVVLTIVMAISAVPLTGIEAKAYGVNGYCATAAAQWAIDHWQDVDSLLYGKGYWYDGGDCANFVSQCIYMGGIDQSTTWNHNGYYAHFGTNSDGSFIRAQQLYDFAVSIGGQPIQNPSASQVSVGDLIFFRKEGSYRLTHSSIVTAVENGVPRIAYHSVYENGGYTKENTTNWTLGYAGKNIYLVKMYGSVCTAQNTRNFDVYTVKSGGAVLYNGTSTSSGRVSTFLDNEYAHVYSTVSANGYSWGYTFRYGKWGWVQLNKLNYQRHVSSAVPTHLMGDWYVKTPSTCIGNGIEQRDCQRCSYYETRGVVGGHVTEVHANCLEPGYCSLCGTKTEDPLGHSFGAWTDVKSPTCTESGIRERSCTRCGYSESETVAALGHNDVYTATAPTCTANGTATYKCNRCGRQTINYVNENNTVSDWTTQVISGLAPLETKTQYRYKTKSTTTSYDSALSGWTQNGGSWVQSSTGSVQYVSSWPSGFDRNHSLYGTYNKTPPSDSETATTKTVINSDSHTGYIYWHYCRNNQSLNLNYPDRLVNDAKTSEFTGFHAYYSTTNYTQYDGSGKVVNAASSGTCKDTQWYFKLNVYTRSYTNYNKLFNYYKWSDWSGWQDASVSANADRQVETRTLYKYNLAKMGHDFSVEGSRKEPTCTEPGYIGMTCSRCGAFSPESIVLPATGHLLYDENSSRGWYVTESTAATTNYRRDCQRFCGYYETKSTHNACIWKKTDETAPTCEKDGKITYLCSLHGETKTQPVSALNHEADNNWILADAASCANGGKDGKEICYCVRNDNGKTCNKTFERVIPAPEHIEVIDNYVSPTCTETGLEEGSHCDVCKEIIVEQKTIDALGHDDSGEWVRVIEPDCGVTGVEHLYCIRECEDGNECGFLIDIRYIDGLEPEYVEKERKNSSCTEIGWIKYTCALCDGTDHEHGYTDFLEMVDHAWGEYDETPAICIYPGEKTRHCDVCGLEDEPVIIAPERTEHNFVETTIPSTCVSGGIATKICSICDFEEDVTDPDPLGHNTELNSERSIAPTCEDPGCNVFECIRDGCDYEYTDILDAIDHNYQPAEEHPATCTESGYIIMVCQNDNSHVYRKYTTDPLGHNWDDGVIDPVSTCKKHGTKTYTCQNDASHTYTEAVVLDENNHAGETYIRDAKLEDCINDGYSGDTYCADCDKKLSDGEVIPATSHDWGEWETVTPATCEEDGLERRICKNDASHVEENVLPAIGHDWDDGVIDPDSTCKEHGTKTSTCQNDASHTYTEEVALDENNHVGETYIKDAKVENCTNDGYTGDTYCADCDKKLSDGEVIPATSHDWGEWETVTPATCEEDGLERRICKNDASHVEENVLPAIGHDWNDGVIDPVSTCKEHGIKIYTCQNDASHTYTEEVKLDENNHTGETYIKDATKADCTNDGYTGDTYCADCDKKLSDGEVIPATGHDWSDWVTTKESSYTENGEEKRTCNNCGAEETRPLPVLTRPSDENENIETKKTVEYDSVTGEAIISLIASSKGEKITVNSRTPLDIVLVLDQSGSMEGDLLKKLKTATDDFTKAIYQDAVANNLDHRIAMVGFAMQNQYNFGAEYYQYLNTEILTTGGAPVQYNSLSTAKMNEVYKNALVSVNVDGTLNPVLTLAKDNLEAKGATAADLGLDMACQIFAQNENDGSRKRIVLFMTDGVPTYKSDYMEETATNATTKANLLKNAYDADLYSVGVLSGGNTSKAKTFLNNIASKDENNKALYFDCADANKLVEDFQTIATQSTTITTDFADITLIDTVSSAFTLTAVQEKELRKNAIEKFGITNDDIIITRYDDGTTEIKLEHINPVAVADGDDVNYVIDIDFRVTANEKALIAGSYGTNTDNAGVIIGTSDVYENNFAVPGATVENAEGVIYFTVNGIVYHIVRVHKGDSPEAPEFTLDGEYTFSGWDIPEEVVFDGGKLTVDATLTQTAYTITWNTADITMTDTYYTGDIIVAPEVGLNAKGEEFLRWDTEVPATMPAENLEFTAIFGVHEHSYTEKVLKKVSCGIEGKVQLVCSCGDSYTETVEALEHNWSTSATSSDGSETAYSYVYCTNCGESPDKTLTYTVTGTSGRKQVTYDLKLVDANNITVQPDGSIKISLPIPQNMKNASNVMIYRVEEDGTKTNLNGTVKNGYITFTTTHFSIYIIEAVYGCDETGIHEDKNSDNICDSCGDNQKVEAPENPSEKCSHICHKSGFMGFIWKIINFFQKLFGINPVCKCGAAHY